MDLKNHLGSSTILVHVICIVPFCAKHGETDPNPNLSPHTSTKKITKKICKAITPIFMCFKTEQQQEKSKKIIRKINKAIQTSAPCLKINQGEDDRCLWKKTILMGEKCQPLQFSGAIFYDSKGNRLSEPPTPRSSSSPRISHNFLLSTLSEEAK